MTELVFKYHVLHIHLSQKLLRDYSNISIFSTFYQGSRHKTPPPLNIQPCICVHRAALKRLMKESLFSTPSQLLGTSLAHSDLSEFILKVLYLSSKNVIDTVPETSHCLCLQGLQLLMCKQSDISVIELMAIRACIWLSWCQQFVVF